jgi:hypothetical protein
MALFEPGGECWAEVEAHQGEVARLRIGPVTFFGNLLVEVLKRRRSKLVRDKSREGILAGRLIKVSIDTEKFMYGIGH